MTRAKRKPEVAPDTFTAAQKFFFEHAGYSVPPGRAVCAVQYAEAEEKAREAGCSFEWGPCDTTSQEFSKVRPFYPLWRCSMRDPKGKMCASMCGIDFGRDKAPWGDPYRRVVEAELASDWSGQQ